MLFADIRSDYYWDFTDYSIVVKDESGTVIKEYMYDIGLPEKKAVSKAIELAEAYIEGLVKGNE